MQFSPRLLRNFLRDRSTQLLLSVFLATFAYRAAGLYTEGVSSGNRVQTYPRLAVSGAMVLLFLGLAMVVFYANHLAHSIQIDSIAKTVEVTTLFCALAVRPLAPVVRSDPASGCSVVVPGLASPTITEAQLILTDAEREVANPADLVAVRAAAERLRP